MALTRLFAASGAANLRSRKTSTASAVIRDNGKSRNNLDEPGGHKLVIDRAGLVARRWSKRRDRRDFFRRTVDLDTGDDQTGSRFIVSFKIKQR